MKDPVAIGEMRTALLAGAGAAPEAGGFAEAENPADLHAMLLRGLALAAQGLSARAAPLLQHVAAARPGLGHPCRDFAGLLPGAPSLVAAQFRACRRLAPQDDALALAYADFLRDAGRPAPAAAVLRALLRRAPRFVAAQKLFGMALLDLGAPAKAVAALRRAVALDPRDAAAWSSLGVALTIKGNSAGSFAAHDRAAALASAELPSP